MRKTVVGRDAELAIVEQFLDATRAGSSSLVLAGTAGIGKTTLWEAAVASAEARDTRILRSRPSASETRLTYAGLLDLVGGVDLDAAADLPRPQRDALEVALGPVSTYEVSTVLEGSNEITVVELAGHADRASIQKLLAEMQGLAEQHGPLRILVDETGMRPGLAGEP